MSPQSPKRAAKSSKTSSHNYFSRLSKRFFKPSAPFGSSTPQTPQSQLTSRKPSQRLCSLKRKSNHYFATQAWKTSPSPTTENLHDRHPDSDRDWQIETMYQSDMGNQASTPTSLQDAPAPSPRSLDPTLAHPPDQPARTKRETTNGGAVDLVSGGIPPDEPPTTGIMTRPLPPPKSRYTVREEAKRAREIIDLINDAEDAGPIIKKMKTWAEGKAVQPATEPSKAAVGSSETAMCLQEARDGRVEQQQVQKGLKQVAAGGAGGGGGGESSSTGSDMRNGEIGSKNESMSLGKRKQKLFGTLSAIDAAARPQHVGTAPNGNKLFTEKPDHSPDRPGLSRPQAGNSTSESANKAAQLLDGHAQRPFLDQTNSMFIDEGYRSFSVPDINGDDLVPENEDELMRRINGSLGLSSPFVQNCRAKAPKLVTPEQAYAAKQQERDVERSRRMREANLAAKRQKSKQMANQGGGLSVGFLEGTEPRKEASDPYSARRNSVNDAGARSEYQNEHLHLMNGGKLKQSKAQGQYRPGDARTSNSANQRQRTMTDATLLDIAENHVKNHGPNGFMDTTQRSSTSAKPSKKLAADSEAVGPRNEDTAETGFIQLLEQQLNSGVPGVKQTAGVSDLESGKSITSHLAPHWRKKRPQMSTPPLASTNGPKESCDSRLAAESRLLELRNDPVSSNASSAVKTLPKLSKEGSLLDQLIKEREGHATLSAESLISGQGSHSTEIQSTPKPARKGYSKRAKATVEKAEAALLRMGLAASVFKDWKGTRKCFWASREQEFAGRREDLEEAIAKVVRKQNTKEVNLRTAASTGRKPGKRSSSNVVAAEAVLQDSGLSLSLIEGLSGYQKVKWAKEETMLAEKKQELGDFVAKQAAQDWTASVPESSTDEQANKNTSWQDTAPAEAEASESEESEEEDGWQYAIKWQGIRQPQNLAETVPLTHVIAKRGTTLEESASEDEEDQVKGPELRIRSDPGMVREQTRIASQGPYQNRQNPDEDLLRQMQRKHFNDLNDEEELFHEYVVKAETWGMTDFPADHILILGRYLDKDKAEERVRDFILRCKPDAVLRDLEIQSVWADGNFSQKMIRDGEAGCRAFVEPVVVSARQYPGLKDKIARRKTYAVLFERTISRKSGNGEVEEGVIATSVDDMQVFTTKSFANWQAKKDYQNWYNEHLEKPQDKYWRRMHDEDLCKHVEELNEEGALFSRKEHIMKGGATDTMRVWVKEIAPKGPRN